MIVMLLIYYDRSVLPFCIIGKCSVYTDQHKKCVFPFIWKGKTYNTCTQDGNYDSPWCAYKVTNALEWKKWDPCTHTDCSRGKNK